jgi:hypothetical protein
MSELKTLEYARKRAIRKNVRALLLNKTEALDQVFINRSLPTQQEKLPALLVYSLGEGIRRFDEAPKTYERSFNLRIEIIVSGTRLENDAEEDDDLDSRLEAIGEQVEALMEVDETLGNLVHTLDLTASEYQQDPDAQESLAVLMLTYNVVFFIDAVRPGSIPLPNFKTLDNKYKVGEDVSDPDSPIDAEHLVTLETT